VAKQEESDAPPAGPSVGLTFFGTNDIDYAQNYAREGLYST
jgi:hypothetical protein